MGGGDFWARFWGVRGTIPAPGPSTVRFGGNTSCVEMRCGERTLVFDAGTGARLLGERLAAEDACRFADLFFSHCHYDHIEGLPFFQPLFDRRSTIRLWAGHLYGRQTTESMVCGYMSRPYFPIGPEQFWATLDWRDFRPGDTLDLGDGITVRTTMLNHPDGAVGYRVDYDGRSICYVTDTEHLPGEPDRNVLALIDRAGLVIYDAMYSDEDFHNFVGYGHSTWQEGVRLCEAADAGPLVVFHHRPAYSDAALDEIAGALEAARPGSIVAREGDVLRPEK